MLNHTSATAPGLLPAILAAIGITPARSQPLTHHRHVDCELILTVSDGFSRQAWVRNGQVRREMRDALLVDQNEHIRITVSNDMPGVRVVSVGDGRLLRIGAGASASIDVAARAEGSFIIEVIGEPAVSRPVDVQARRANTRAA